MAFTRTTTINSAPGGDSVKQAVLDLDTDLTGAFGHLNTLDSTKLATATAGTTYAPIAKGVTNGDTHDHSGGDGAQIAYSGLSGLPALGSMAAQNTSTYAGPGSSQAFSVGALSATTIGAAGATTMTLDASGNLGIGVTPVCRLHVSTDAAVIGRFYRAASSTGIDIGSDSTGVVLMPIGVDAYQFYNTTGSTMRMKISTSGNILVGTATDDGVNKLQVAGSAKSTGYVQAIAAKTANYTLTSTDYTITTSGNITVTLPAAASHTGRLFVVKKTDSNATVTTVDGTDSETIDGALSYSLTAQYESITVQSNGTQWLII